MAQFSRFVPVTIVAEWLHCSKKHVYDLVHEGLLEAVNASASSASITDRTKAIRISVASYEEFVASRKIDPLKYAQ